jgi:succinyl-CoA---D-citramalate CoA-transferase
VFARLAQAMERPDLATAFASHEARAARQHELDDEIARWTRTRAAADLLATLQAHEVPVGLINRAPDLLQDPHIAAREMIVRLAAGFAQPVPMANVVPKFSRTPGAIRHGGPELGADTEAVLRDVAGCSPAEIEALRDAGVVGRG